MPSGVVPTRTSARLERLDELDRRLRVLFVCSMNQWRSPTAETLWRCSPDLDVRSRGLSQKARRTLTREDLEISDEYRYMDPELVELLQTRVGPVISEALAMDDHDGDGPDA